MIDDNLNIKLIDFGVSRIASRTSTFTKDVSGTTRYMAPEFYDIDETGDLDKPIRITNKLDIWSTGCLISEIFSGVIPWMNAVKNEVSLRKKLMQKVPFPIPNEIKDHDVKELIEKCLKIDPVERISSSDLTELIKEKMKKFDK
jgi:serine/threonine protein kinase